MRVGIISAYTDYRRNGAKRHGVLQPGVGTLIAALLPPETDVHIVNESWEDADFTRDYDLLYISCLHPDFDRARQISHYWRKRGAKTVLGGIMASEFPALCKPFFDAIAIGDAEGCARRIYDDFARTGKLDPYYVSEPYDASRLPVPRFDLLAGRHHVPLAFEATRGCPFTCEFCALTGIGTRFHTRPVSQVVRDIRKGQDLLAGKVRWPKRKFIMFLDNNLGGNLQYLSDLARALRPLDVRWGGALTFNAIAAEGMAEKLFRGGFRVGFVGLESFNPKTLQAMNKPQNLVAETRSVIDRCNRNGVLLMSGLVLSPTDDDVEYIDSIPEHLRKSGLYQPSFIAFESPIPGTPYFQRLAAQEEPAFLPNAYLRDFSGYTLAVRPKRATPEEFVAAYKRTLQRASGLEARVRKVLSDVPKLISGGGWDTAIADVVDRIAARDGVQHDRTYLAGTDKVPPEISSVPFRPSDFDSEGERDLILNSWKVTDEQGFALPAWRTPVRVFEAKGQVSAPARALVQVQV